MAKCCVRLQRLSVVLMEIKFFWHVTLHSVTKQLPNFNEIVQDLPSPTGKGSSFGNYLPLDKACVVVELLCACYNARLLTFISL